MRVLALFLADHAEAVKGKLYVVGGFWNRIWGQSFPVRHGHMTVCLVIEVPWDETNVEHTLQLRLIDEDGTEMGPKLDAQFEAGRPPGTRKGDSSTFPIAINLEGLTFGKPGTYEFAASIDGEEMLPRASFKVVKGGPAGPQSR